ncbi:tetratricopeptide repeat protein 19, mitochondrial-like [Carassius gibelio]|uniref:tetratricopeptide repeat protein 19, mitochondrial-like n=1 Tax=Carassius gibelio TaxID=101364 RepID=UPI002278B789|nr:tetratricopeptide repeat protein 19, mitochondrial-like [Carassius gibelio]XP_052464905.1 tetratricopeptide repeat protein 19, mitochondrial-like [Carassius gibelio]
MALRSCCRRLAAQVARLKHCVNDCTRNVSGSGLSLARIKPLHEPAAVFVRSWHLCVSEQRPSGAPGVSNWTLAWGVMAFSLFGSSDERTEEQKLEDELILLLKKAKYSMMIGELDAANGFLHKAVRLAHQMHNNDAIIYTYSLMANLAFVQGQLENAEKLFKAAMSFMLSGGTPQDDNAVIEMSLKLASIYATQNKNELAEHGFQFCTESLEAKIEKQKELPQESLSDEERKDTRLLLGLSLDARARYLAANHHFTGACRDYRHALQICQEEQGESHPQSLVLLSDLATVLDLQGKHDEALAHVKKAVELGHAAGHPDQHVLLGNMAGILMHKGEFEESSKLYQEALALARAAGDGEAVEQLQEGLKELASRRDGQTESKPEEQEHKD